MFTDKQLNKVRIKGKLIQFPFNKIPIFEDVDQLYLLINEVKITFFSFPFPVKYPTKLYKNINMPTLLSLAAMKAFALERRAKWKDYVDLYFILQNNYNIQEICAEANEIFGQQFSEKLFR